MISNNYFANALRFVLLLLAQVLVFNNLNFFGYINPMIYVLFLYWYPVREKRAAFIIVSFLLGLMVDWFSDTLAIHAAATVTVAYLRPALLRFCFGVNLEFQNFKLTNSTKVQQITFLTLLIVLHHLVFFSLEIFSLENTLLILKKVFAVSAASIILCLLLSSLFSVGKE